MMLALPALLASLTACDPAVAPVTVTTLPDDELSAGDDGGADDGSADDGGSDDGTPEWVETASRSDAALRLVRQAGRPDLSASVMEGFRAARGGKWVVMDADGQHDPAVLPAICRPMKRCFSHRPAFMEAVACGMCRAAAKSMAMACSAVVTALPWGALSTTTPRASAAWRSTLSRPMPARPTTRRRCPAPRTSAVTLVRPRTSSAS